jgi:hypothetical protein
MKREGAGKEEERTRTTTRDKARTYYSLNSRMKNKMVFKFFQKLK